MKPPSRVIIEDVMPAVDGGRFPIKRTLGERVLVEADVFADGHDLLTCLLLHRHEGESTWKESPMAPLGNDRWRGELRVRELGRHYYTVEAWIDDFKSWRRDFRKRVAASQDIAVDLLVGRELVRRAASRATGDDQVALRTAAERIGGTAVVEERIELALDDDLAAVMARHPDRQLAARHEPELAVTVDRLKARFSAWYELFPRSTAPEPGCHGTFRDCESKLPYIASMGFDVLYLPPIHPVGVVHRKGKNNATTAAPGDPGSPWAIGSALGGHTALHPELGTLEDFRRFLARAAEHGLEVALDLAFQCAPDHPFVKEHPGWFRQRPDGSIQYAENPPKKYQDIFPFDFDSTSWRELWEELKGVVDFWIAQGVRIFRVDNPHTKPFPFWEWILGELKKEHPDLIFLAEAFTRPRIMHRLAKLGFTQSYTYFAWRNTKREIVAYLTELTGTAGREYLRPNLWPNTPDILTEALQHGGRAMFMSRLVLAATLGASYGIYGPTFELCEGRARAPGSEEYLGSEKYELRHWDLDHPDSLRDLIARVNRIRQENAPLAADWSLKFQEVDNDEIIAYSKRSEDGAEVILVVVNLDPHHVQTGWLRLSMEELGLEERESFQVHDLLSGARYLWQGPRSYVELDPDVMPCHIFRLRRRVRSEADFEYYL